MSDDTNASADVIGPNKMSLQGDHFSAPAAVLPEPVADLARRREQSGPLPDAVRGLLIRLDQAAAMLPEVRELLTQASALIAAMAARHQAMLAQEPSAPTVSAQGTCYECGQPTEPPTLCPPCAAAFGRALSHCSRCGEFRGHGHVCAPTDMRTPGEPSQ